MNQDGPLPLIQPTDTEDDSSGSFILYRYGYAIISLSWAIFIVTANSVFQFWKFVIEPLSWTESTRNSYDYLYSVFVVIDEYVLSLWGVYVVAWWWTVSSWIGLKLFKQSKGTQT